MALTVIKPSGIETSGNYTVNGMNVSANASVANLSVTNSANLGAVGNVIITGGTNGYVLQTDGSGTLSWVAQSGGGSTSNISNGNSNVNIPSANGNINFSAVGNSNVVVITGTGVNVTGTLNTGSGIITGNGNGLSSLVGANVTGQVSNSLISGTVYTNAQPNITSVGTLTSLDVSGTVTAAAFTANTGVFTGNGNGLSSIVGANVTGQVANSLVSGTIYTNAQPNITSVGTLTSLSVTGNISAGNANLGNNASANFFTGNGIYLTGITTAGLSNGNSNVNIPSANGNINFSAVGNTVMVITGTGVNVAGTLNTGSGIITGNGNGLSSIVGANVTGQVANSLIAGTVYTNAQPNITSVGTLTSLTATGNVTGGNLVTAGKVYASEMLNGGTGIYLSAGPAGYINFFTTGGDKASISDTGNIIASNLIANSTVFATTANISANVNAGNANLGNLVTANFFSGAGNNLSNIQAANISGQVANALIAGTVYTNAQPNITSVGTLTDLSVSGNGVFGGNLTVNGTLTYINSTTLSISDPIINLQTGPNGAAPVANSGKDVGTALNYYDTSAKIAWMGWDVSNAEIAFGSNVGISSEVVTFTELANIRSGNASLGNNVSANFFTGNGVYLTGITTSGVSNGNSNVNIPAANGNVNISAVGNANVLVVTGTGANISGTLNVTGNATLGNIITSGSGGNITNVNVVIANTFTGSFANGNSNVNIPAANGNVNISAVGNANVLVVTGTGANINGTANITGNLVTGNASLGNLVTANFFSGSGNNLSNIQASNITGQVANALIAGTVYTNAQPNITSVGTLTSLDVTGNISGGNANLGNLVTANFFAGNGITLSALTFGNITTFTTAGLTTDELYLQGTTRLNVTASGASGYLFDQYGATLNPALYITSGQTLAFNLNVSGHPFLIQTSGGANYDTGLEHVDTTGTVLSASSAQGQIAGTLYWKVPYGITGNYKYQCSVHGGMNGNIVVTDANVANIQVGNSLVSGTVYTNAQPNITSVGTLTSLDVTGNITSGNANLGNAVTSNFFIGAGNNLSNIQGSNVSGQVSNSLIAGTVYTNAQPNITSVGSLTGLVVSNATGVVDFTTTANVTLGAVANLHISGGTGGYVLSTDGSGTLSWIAQSGGGSSTISNGNSNVNIPAANGNINFTAVGNTVMVITGTGANISGTLAVTGNLITGNANLGNAVSANYFIGSGNNLSNIQGSNVTGAVSSATTAGTVTTNAQPNITSVGSLTGLTVSNATGIVDFTTTANVTLGAVANLHISGGTNGYVLSTNGSGALSWVAQSGGGSPGGINTQVQFNDAGTFGGNAEFVFNKTTTTLTANNFVATSTANLGSNANVIITGGTNGYVLSTNGSGALSWVAQSGGGGGASISNGNSNVNIPAANGNINFTAIGNTIMVITGTGVNVAGTLNTGSSNANLGNLGTAQVFASANITSPQFISNIAIGTAPFVVTSTTQVANLSVATAGSATTAGTVTTNAQPNITSVGSLTGLVVSNATGVVDFTTTANVTLGAVANLHISGGTGGYVLSTDGSGTLSWIAQSGGGGASISNGNSNVNIPVANGNINFTAVGNANVLVVTGTGANISGTLEVTGNSNVGNLNVSGNITDTTGPLTISTSGGTGGNLSLSADSVGRIILDGMAWPAADGTNGYVLQTNGSNDLSWVAQASSTITDNTTSVSTFYPVYATASSGSFTTAGISSTKLQFIPSTGTLTVTDLNTLSDATLKENPEAIADPMVVLSQLFGMGFNWIDTKKKSYGLMAQMVEKILPELVSTNEQGQKALNYIPIIAFLIEAVKKQQEDIDNLKKRSIKKR